MEQLFRVVGFLVGTFFLTNILNIFIVGLQFELFSVKYWGLFALSAMVILIGRDVLGGCGKSNNT